MNSFLCKLMFLAVLGLPGTQNSIKPSKYILFYSGLFSRIENGIINKNDAKLYMEGVIYVEKNNSVEGSEWASEVLEKIVMYSPYEFIYWYDKLNEEDKKIILFYLSDFPEDTDIERIITAVKKTKTVHFRAKREILNAIG